MDRGAVLDAVMDRFKNQWLGEPIVGQEAPQAEEAIDDAAVDALLLDHGHLELEIVEQPLALPVPLQQGEGLDMAVENEDDPGQALNDDEDDEDVEESDEEQPEISRCARGAESDSDYSEAASDTAESEGESARRSVEDSDSDDER